ncbi:hypothetical protein GA0070616_1099 [Micromonospora nigra]|uniref:Uncharacterized protein n=1 Tax=Micromonospora nigra TaxID=145857 RepID=A0A1C6RHX2_9ACTN|nr:hypothetical protein GA0070616_1099 [Micromonospora nigra]
MATCANPDCPEAQWLDTSRWSTWVQVQQTTLAPADQHGSHVVQTNFAAVTCSKRCAIAVLGRDLEVEDARRERFNPFAPPQPERSE